jgi:hypothetical protein
MSSGKLEMIHLGFTAELGLRIMKGLETITDMDREYCKEVNAILKEI